MSEPKVGLISFGDEREEMWEKVFRDLAEPRHQLGHEYLAELPVEFYSSPDVARTLQQINAQVDDLKAKKVDVLIAHIPCWTAPNLVVHGIQQMGLPTVIVTSQSAATHGMVGFLGAGGALKQVGIDHLRIREDFKTDAMTKKLMPFIWAAYVKNKLRGETFGMFGGRSLGIDTGCIDPLQWRSQFGIDVEHIDQLEIIRRADLIPAERTRKMLEWLKQTCGKIEFNDTVLTEEKLSFQINCYLATKDIAKDKHLDFVAVKCMPDMTNHYVPQCLTAALMPGPYDGEGDKPCMAMGCEADGDNALTMEIMQQITGGKATLFGDLSHMDIGTQTLYLPNCGAQSTWFAQRSDDPAQNMRHVELIPSVRPGGGATVYFRSAPGSITLARLYRWSGEYRMAIIPGEAVELSQEKLDEFIEARGKHQLPTAFVKVPTDLDKLIDEFSSNHIAGVAGDCVKALEHFCRMTGITPVVMDENY
jgi:L-fucose/D-arabinose isomerase